MANVNIVLGPRGAGMADMPVPAAVYVSQEKKDVTTVSDSSITVPAASNDLFWFVTPETVAIRVLEHTPADAASNVAITTGWFVPAGTRWEAKAAAGKTLSLILG